VGPGGCDCDPRVVSRVSADDRIYAAMFQAFVQEVVLFWRYQAVRRAEARVLRALWRLWRCALDGRA
jgi:hypothetical protein